MTHPGVGTPRGCPISMVTHNSLLPYFLTPYQRVFDT